MALAIAKKTRTLLLRRGYRVAMTRTGPTFRGGNGGNVARAQFCNRRNAALMLRIHADGSQDSSSTECSTLYPELHRGWTDDIYTRASGPRGRPRATVRATGALTTGSSSAAT